jgi:pilus assembly protein Flp/PilA
MKGGRNNATRIWKVLQDDSGASAVEYALLIGLIAVVIAAAVSTLGTTLTGIFSDAANKVGS